MLLNALVQLGLSEKEASVYMMLLRVGASPVSTLAKRLQMKRVTTYSVLDSLKRKGYVTFQKRGACRKYIPQDPECILEDLERRNEQLRVKLSLAKDCVQRLQAFPQKKQVQVKVAEVFFGLKAEQKLRSVISLDSPIHVISMSSPTNHHILTLLERLNGSHSQVHIGVRREHYDEFSNRFNFSCLNILKSEALLTGDLLVQGDRVMFLSFSEDLELSVQVDQNYANLLVHLFNSSYHTKHLTSSKNPA